MIIETLATFSKAQSLATLGTPVKSTAWVNMGEMRLMEVAGLWIHVKVTTAFSDGGIGATLMIGVCTADDNAGTNCIAHILSGGVVNFGAAAPVGMVNNGLLTTVGSEFFLPLPRASKLISGLTSSSGGFPTFMQKFLGLVYFNPTNATDQWVSGALTAELVIRPPRSLLYADGVA